MEYQDVNTNRQADVTDRSGTITTGGTAQDAMAANSNRRYLFIQNNHSSADLWVNFGADANTNQPSFKLTAGQSYENPAHFCPTSRVSVIGGTTGQTFTAKEG